MFDYVSFLTNRKFIGPVFPWWKDHEGKYFQCLLVPVDVALSESIFWSNDKDLTRTQFIKYLKEHDILIFRDIEEFIKWRDNIKEIEKMTKKTKVKRNISEERKKQLQEQARLMREKQKDSTTENPL